MNPPEAPVRHDKDNIIGAESVLEKIDDFVRILDKKG